MAVVRTVLPRKGIIQPKHGDNYESDVDTNWQLIDSLMQDSGDVQAALAAAGGASAWLQDLHLSGVVSGFTLSTSAALVPGLATGVLYAQGIRHAPAAPNPGPAPPSSTSTLWWNSVAGFYYNLTGVSASSYDACLGSVTTNATQVTSVRQATRLYGQLAVVAPAAGAFSWPHYLGRTPNGAVISMTSGGALWYQSSSMFDTTNLYLVASEAGVTAQVQLW